MINENDLPPNRSAARESHAIHGLRFIRTFLNAAMAALVWWSASQPTASHASTIIVKSLADSGSGSLREALAGAQNGDTVIFYVTGTITNTSGELVISNSVDILGPGPSYLAVSGQNLHRAFRITSGTLVSLSGLTIREGRASSGGDGINRPGDDGGGIYNLGNLALTNCVFVNCRSGLGGIGFNDPGWPANLPPTAGGSGGNGGAIYNAGTLAAMNCSFLTNLASAGGSGGRNLRTGAPGADAGSGGNGGGVYNIGTARCVGCVFGYNSAGAGGGGGAGGSGSTSSPGPGGFGGRGGNGGTGGAAFGLGA